MKFVVSDKQYFINFSYGSIRDGHLELPIDIKYIHFVQYHSGKLQLNFLSTGTGVFREDIFSQKGPQINLPVDVDF